MKRLSVSQGTTAGLKFTLIAFLVLIFLIPLGFIQSLIRERSVQKEFVQQEIVESWGGRNLLAGPYLIIPYKEEIKSYDKEKEEFYISSYLHHQMIYLPESLILKVKNESELRSRGIYSVPVFMSDVEMSGHFDPSLVNEILKDYIIQWDNITIGYSLPSTKALASISPITLGDEILTFSPAPRETALLEQQITSPVSQISGTESHLSFDLSMELKGGSSLHFLPTAKDTTVSLWSDWTSPSFNGTYLPTSRELNETYTQAEWRINYLSRSFPQYWEIGSSEVPYLLESTFGLDLMEPVTSYSKNTRTAKYGLLFLIIPFMVFFLFEVISATKIHPIQYLMAGLGNVVFYLLLLALSEHLSFNMAYLLSAAGVISLVTLYARSVLGKGSRGWIMAPILLVCYSYLFVVLQSEDYALLLGSFGLFFLVAVIMFLTRRINWYGLGKGRDGGDYTWEYGDEKK